MKRILALNDLGNLTYCTVPLEIRGQRGCNHSMHKEESESTDEFVERVNKHLMASEARGFSPIVADKVESLIKKERMFVELNDKLGEIGESIDIAAAGGFSLQTYGLRSTMDVDAFFNSSGAIDGVIREIGEKEGINMDEELWLNNSIMNRNEDPRPEETELILDLPHLKVRHVKAEKIFIMKLSTDRSRDIDDCIDMLKAGMIDIKTMADFKAMCKASGVRYSEYKDRAVEAMTDAFGFDWYIQEMEKGDI